MQKDRWRKMVAKAGKMFVKGVRTRAGSQPPIGKTPDQVQADLDAHYERLIQLLDKPITPKTKRRKK